MKFAFFVFGVLVVTLVGALMADYFMSQPRRDLCAARGLSSIDISNRVLCVDADRRLVLP